MNDRSPSPLPRVSPREHAVPPADRGSSVSVSMESRIQANLDLLAGVAAAGPSASHVVSARRHSAKATLTVSNSTAPHTAEAVIVATGAPFRLSRSRSPSPAVVANPVDSSQMSPRHPPFVLRAPSPRLTVERDAAPAAVITTTTSQANVPTTGTSVDAMHRARGSLLLPAGARAPVSAMQPAHKSNPAPHSRSSSPLPNAAERTHSGSAVVATQGFQSAAPSSEQSNV
jgi:hypothetical protein